MRCISRCKRYFIKKIKKLQEICCIYFFLFYKCCCYGFALVAEQVDAADLKSVGSNPVPVRFRPSAPFLKKHLVRCFFCFKIKNILYSTYDKRRLIMLKRVIGLLKNKTYQYWCLILFMVCSIFFLSTLNLRKDVSVNYPIAGVGDYWLAKDLTGVFLESGFNAYLFNEKNIEPQYNVVLRGNLSHVEYAKSGEKNILWLAWSNLKINGKERTMPLDDYVELVIDAANQYDTLVVSSKKLYTILKEKMKKPVYFAAQFTNTDKFYYDYDPKVASKILFVGNYHFDRMAAKVAFMNNYPIHIYGDMWPKGVAIKEYIDNRILRKYYSSADIVLNDTKQNMKDFGFVSNRIFDVTACKAFVISDYMPEIEEIYGDSIPMYKNEEELLNLLDYYLAHPEERKKKALQAYNITTNKFTQIQASKVWKDILNF